MRKGGGRVESRGSGTLSFVCGFTARGKFPAKIFPKKAWKQSPPGYGPEPYTQPINNIIKKLAFQNFLFFLTKLL